MVLVLPFLVSVTVVLVVFVILVLGLRGLVRMFVVRVLVMGVVVVVVIVIAHMDVSRSLPEAESKPDNRLDMTEDPIVAYLQDLLEQHRGNVDGAVATYIPELAKADPTQFAICLVTVEGAVYEVGDARQQFTIQSISKPFTYGLILDELGAEAVEARIGVEPTGDAFNSISLEPDTGKPLNPMINAGAIAAAGLVAERHGQAAETELLAAYGRHAGRALDVDDAVYASESGTAHRNRAIAHLLFGSGSVRVEPEAALDLYLRQCSVNVDVRDLAVMAATLANGGVNPVTGERAATAETVTKVLTVMTTCGMYDAAGQWLYDVGLPAKSGVGGGIIAVLPGRLGIAVFSPALDEHGNSVRGVAVCRQLARELNLQLLRSSIDETPPIRASYTLQRSRSKRVRTDAQAHLLAERGHEALAIELQGHLDFTAVERSVKRVMEAVPPPRYVVLDLSHVTEVYQATGRFRDALAATLVERGGSLVLSGTTHLGDRLRGSDVVQFDDLDHALEWIEDQLIGGNSTAARVVDARDNEAVVGLDAAQVDRLTSVMEHRAFGSGELVQRQGMPFEGLLLLTGGRLSMYAGMDEARRRVATLEAGMLLGELSVIGGTAVTDVVADTDTEALLLPTAAFHRLRETDPETAAALTTNLLTLAARRVDRLRDLLASLDA